MPSKCKHEENGKRCTKYASYGTPGTSERLFCKIHASKGMVITRNDTRVCNHPDHKNDEKIPRASFGLPNEKPTRCKEHLERGMMSVNLKNPCEICGTRARTHGPENGKPRFCKTCSDLSEKKYEDLRSGKCASCKKWATFGFSGKGRTHCKKHKQAGMIDLKNGKCKICVKENVANPKQPTYGYEKPTHCKEHKTEDMKDLRHQSCLCIKCSTRASYGYMHPTRCRKHAEFGMECLVGQMCVKCEAVQGVFAVSKGGDLYCKKCKQKEMKNVKGKMCDSCGEKQPVFNYQGLKRKFCGDCKDPFMVDVVNPRCKQCKLYITLPPRKLCAICNIECSHKKLKEQAVIDFFHKNADTLQIPKSRMIHNKKISLKNTNIFPDLRIYPLDKSHVVIIEIDEFQHKKGDYDLPHENERMKLIAQAEQIPCIFLRYNPDVFYVNEKKKIVPQNERLGFLLENAQKFLTKKIFKKNIYVYKLFYDIACEIDDNKYLQEYNLLGYFNELDQKIVKAIDAETENDEETKDENNEENNEENDEDDENNEDEEETNEEDEENEDEEDEETNEDDEENNEEDEENNEDEEENNDDEEDTN